MTSLLSNNDRFPVYSQRLLEERGNLDEVNKIISVVDTSRTFNVDCITVYGQNVIVVFKFHSEDIYYLCFSKLRRPVILAFYVSYLAVENEVGGWKSNFSMLKDRTLFCFWLY